MIYNSVYSMSECYIYIYMWYIFTHIQKHGGNTGEEYIMEYHRDQETYLHTFPDFVSTLLETINEYS